MGLCCQAGAGRAGRLVRCGRPGTGDPHILSRRNTLSDETVRSVSGRCGTNPRQPDGTAGDLSASFSIICERATSGARRRNRDRGEGPRALTSDPNGSTALGGSQRSGKVFRLAES
jgi:hypothetical protein